MAGIETHLWQTPKRLPEHETYTDYTQLGCLQARGGGRLVGKGIEGIKYHCIKGRLQVLFTKYPPFD